MTSPFTRKGPTRAHAHRPSRVVEPLEPRTLLAAPTVIDVMVVYNADAKTKLGVNDAGIQKLIRQSVESANQVHYNTGDNVVLRLVHTPEQVDYSNDGGSINDDLDRLSNPSDGFMDNVQALRNTYGADLVSLVSTPDTSTAAGLANLLDDINRPDRADLAFSVVSATAIGPGQFTLAHETGHNLGAGHERDNFQDPTPNPVFPYSFGYHFIGDNGNEYADIMSYQGLELPYFSDPNIIYQGQPLGKPVGDADAADLHSTFLQTAPVVAAYRASLVPPDTAAPTATLYQADVVGSQLTFTIRYTDDVSVNASTLGSGDVSVKTPEGFNLAAELLSLDAPGDGYAKLATYRVTLPASNPPLASLQFFLNANQVKDVNNNTTAAGQIQPNADFDIDAFSFQRARDTGALPLGDARQIGGNLSPGDTQDFYKFTVADDTDLSVKLSGLSAGAEIYLVHDVNGNDQFDGQDEQITGTPNSTATTDRSFTATLTPGTYCVLVQLDNGQGATNYSLNVRGYDDTTPPTATLDALDTRAATTTLNFSVIFADDQDLDFNSVRFNAVLGFQVRFTTGGGFTGTTGSPTGATILPDGRIVASYSINLGQNLPNGTVTLTVDPSATVQDAAGNLLTTGATLGVYRLAGNPAQADTAVPTATIQSAPPVLVPAGTGYNFTVAYHDNQGVPGNTLDGNDINVTGPGGFTQLAQFISASVSPGASFTYAVYHVNAPGGSWDYPDDGTYTVSVQAGGVKDAAGNAVPAGAIGAFTVHAPYPGDATGDDKNDFNDLVALAQNYNTPAGRGYATGDFTFDGAVDFNDLVILAQNYNSALPPAGAAAIPLPIASAVKPGNVMAKKAIFSVTPVAKAVAKKSKLPGKPLHR